MRIDSPSLATGALGGATLGALLGPFMGGLATAFGVPVIALAGAAAYVHFGASSRRYVDERPEPPPELPPSRTPREWLEDYEALDSRLAETDVEERIRDALRRQLRPFEIECRHIELFRALGHLLDRGSRQEGRRMLDALAAHPDWEPSGRGTGTDVPAAFLDTRHGTLQTQLLALIDRVRREGVAVSSSEMVWLKASDRPLWYAVNNLGRSAFHVEGLAAIAHYREEVAAGQALAEPAIDTAADSLMAIVRAERQRAAEGRDER